MNSHMPILMEVFDEDLSGEIVPINVVRLLGMSHIVSALSLCNGGQSGA